MRGLTAGIGSLAFTLACFAQHHPGGSSGSSSERSASERRSSDSSSAHASDSGAGHTASSPGSNRGSSDSSATNSASATASGRAATTGPAVSSPGSNRGSTDSSSSRLESAAASGRAARAERNDAQIGDGRMHMSEPPTGSKHGKPASHPPVAGNDQKNTAQPKSKDSIHLLQLIAACRANGGFVVNGHCLPPGVVGLGRRYYYCFEAKTQRACRPGDVQCECRWEYLPNEN